MSHFFNPRFEQDGINRGVARQQHEQGFTVLWWFYNTVRSTPDPLYAEGGRKYDGPNPMPVFDMTRTFSNISAASQGEGLYVVDNLVLHIGYQQAADAGLLPLADETHDHLRDRFVFEHAVWTPTTITPRNKLGRGGSRSMLVILATQVTNDEMVNDDDFLKYASSPYVLGDVDS